MIKKIQITPYVVELWVIISKDPYKEVAQTNVSNPGINITWGEGFAAWTNDHFYEDNIIACVFDSDHFGVDTVSHEVVHIKNMIYMHAGIKHDPNNDEPEAYLTGWICEQIFNVHKEYKKAKK